jgi:hypothetical protein
MGSAEARGWLTYVWEIDAVDECECVNHCECGEQAEVDFTDDTSCFSSVVGGVGGGWGLGVEVLDVEGGAEVIPGGGG